MLLMFGVGLHFSLNDLLAVRHIALPGAIVQIVVATLLGAGVAALWGWSLSAGVVFGLALSVASTVVLLKALESRGVLETVNGRIAVGWLVVEDLVTVLVLVLLPPLSLWLGGNAPDDPLKTGDRSLLTTLALTLGQVAVFIGLMLVVGRRLFPKLLWLVARTGSRELFTLCVIAAAVGIAYGSAALFGVSFALGAFFAGVVMSESPLSYRAAEESLPFRDCVLGFVFRFRRYALRPPSTGARAVPCNGSRGDHHLGQVTGCLLSRFAVPLSAQHGAYGIGEPRPDRRVFLHPGRTGTFLGPSPGRRPEPCPRWGNHLDRVQSAGIPRHRAGAGLDSFALEAGSSFGTSAMIRSRRCQ